MKETAQIVCRKEPFGAVCEWQGDVRGVAVIGGQVVRQQVPKYESPADKIIRLGGLKLRIIEPMWSVGLAYDSFYVMLAHNPYSQLAVLYRTAVHWLARRAVVLEAHVRGFMLQDVQGREMPFTAKLYRVLSGDG